MPRIKPQPWKILECIFLRAGFSFVRQTSSHRVYEKPGISRPIIIPAYEAIDVDIIKSLMRTACMSREEYFSLLEHC